MNQDFSELVEFLDDKFAKIDKRFLDLDNKISSLPTKSYLDDKFAELKGDYNSKIRKEDHKVTRLTEMLGTKSVLSDSELSELGQIKVF